MLKRYWKMIPAIFLVGILLAYQKAPLEVVEGQSDHKVIEVKGEVQSPGVYELPWHATIEDAITAAGGACQEADLDGLNQTYDLMQGEVLIIPKKKEQVCISINTATIEELDSLPGIGEKMAQRIIEERKLAPFISLEDIKRVKGIGEKAFAKLKEFICL